MKKIAESRSVTAEIMRPPTTTNAGAVAAAGTAPISGAMNSGHRAGDATCDGADVMASAVTSFSYQPIASSTLRQQLQAGTSRGSGSRVKILVKRWLGQLPGWTRGISGRLGYAEGRTTGQRRKPRQQPGSTIAGAARPGIACVGLAYAGIPVRLALSADFATRIPRLLCWKKSIRSFDDG